ncbi:MAG: helix-turn-helix domain-containing protein [Gemmatimonadales bacterium]
MTQSPVPPPETLREFIRRMRERRELTQEEAAEAVGVGLRQYQSYEAGSAEIPRDRFAAIAKTFGVTEHVVEVLAGGQAWDYNSYAAGLLHAADVLEKQVADLRRVAAATPASGALRAARVAGKKAGTPTPAPLPGE